MRRTLLIAGLAVREALRCKIALAGALLGTAFLVIFGSGFYFINLELRENPPMSLFFAEQQINFVVMFGLYAVNFLAVAMAVLISVDSLSGEITSGTMQALAARPLRRFEIVLGKWLGLSLMAGLYLLLLGGGVLLIVGWISGYHLPDPWQGLLLIYLECLLVMTVSLACSSALSTLAAGAVVFGLYGLALLGGWVEQFGSLVGNPTAMDIGIFTSLILPSEALWKYAAYLMSSPVLRALGGMSPFLSSVVPSPLMLGYALVYLLLVFTLALTIFQRRDL